jgi:predicted transcriptional regulator with HTH domain
MINFNDRVATNQPKIGRDITDKILKGNTGAIAAVMNRFHGIDNNIALGLVETLKNDPVIILDSIYKISEQLGLDPELTSQ